MGIYRSHTTAAEFSETAATNNMKLKFLDDGSVWARIHWLNVIKDATYFKDAAQVADCVAVNRFSKIGIVENFGGSMVTLTNLAPQIIGTTGFTSSYQSINDAEGWHKYNSSSLKITSTTSLNEATSTSGAVVPLVNGHTYYVRVEIKQSSIVGACQIYLGGTTAGSITEPYLFSGKKVSAVNTWTIASGIGTRTFPTGNHKLRLDFDNSKVAGDMTYDGLMVIDLTAAFGPNFTPTQAWCDANIPYFTGTKIIDAASSGYKRWEFMLTYPQLSSTLYNRWSQTGSPNESAPGGYTRITTAWPAHAGPIRKMASTSLYNCDNVGTTTWFAAIGQYSAWTATQAIPGADGNPQVETELWVRIDNLSPSQKVKIYDGNHIVGGHIYEF
jgi:hypothetical protein